MTSDGRQRRRTLFGGLLIAGLLGTAVLIFLLEGIVASFEDKYRIVAVMPAAPGVIDGTPVWVSGSEVGEVRSVGFMQSNSDTLANVAVTLELPEHVASQVRADSRVRLASSSIIGGAVIDIAPGTAAAPLLGPGDTLRAGSVLTAELLIGRAAATRADMDTLLIEVRRLTPLLSARMQGTRRALTSMQLAMGEAGRISQDLRTGPGIATLRDPAFSASLQRARGHVAAMPALLERMRQRSGQAGEVVAALGRLRTRTDSLSAQLTSLTLSAENGTLMRLQQDTALLRALHAAQASLDSLMVEARRRPLQFVF